MSHELIQQMHAEDGCDGETLAECIQQLRDQRDGAQYALEAERTAIIDGVNGIVKEIDSRAWIANSRGPYEWNDDRYRQEFVDAGAAIFGALEPLRKIGSDLSNCPRTTRQVIEARTIAKLQAHVAALRAALEGVASVMPPDEQLWANEQADKWGWSNGNPCLNDPEADQWEMVADVHAVLAATPEQSLERVRAEAAAEALENIAGVFDLSHADIRGQDNMLQNVSEYAVTIAAETAKVCAKHARIRAGLMREAART